jgi:tetratricopeptide (TPR) repeat protein
MKIKPGNMKNKIHLLFAGILFTGISFGQTTVEGVKQFRYEKPAAAEQTFRQVLAKNPSDLEAYYWLARIALATDSGGKAIFVPPVPDNVKAQPLVKVVEGIISLKQGDTIRSMNLFNEAIGTGRKKDPALQLAIADAVIDAPRGNLSYALALLEEAEKKDKKNPQIFIARGDAYRKIYNGSDAFKNYQSALALDKTNPVPYFKIGKIYQTQNNTEVFTEYYNNAINADPSFGPVYYQLYYYYYSKDVNRAMENLQKFIALSDPGVKNNYLLTDQYFVSRKYNEAISEAKKIISIESAKTKPRIYKLLAFSYDALKDGRNAGENLKLYFEKADDSLYTPDDFELMAKIAETNKEDSMVSIWYEKALTLQPDPKKKADIVKKIIAVDKKLKLYDKQAYWFGQLRLLPAEMSNVDIFNWGVANYNAKDYVAADSVFGIYATKYPEQSFGYYWRARSNAAMDTAMETGIAVPHYENLIRVASKDSLNANNKKWLIQAYGYIAAFKVNTEKKYDDALVYYDKILQLDPSNNDAEKYKEILEKMIDSKTPLDKPKE